ncbi:MAG: DUF2029 domain-containing protein [Bacteroidota bacterium]|nr:DUF2029 domain-containing protein [Bacteroidota bacterium]
MRLNKWIVFAATMSFLLLSVAKSFYYSEKDGGCDLRARTVASRLLKSSHSPYFYKWKISDGSYFLDPNQHNNRTVCGTSVTPAFLYIIYPVSVMPYLEVRRIWTFLLYLMLGGTICFIILSHHERRLFYPTVLIILGLVCSNNWIFNIERGQVYPLYTFILALSYYLFHAKHRHARWMSGFVAGLLILLRPLAVVVGLAFFRKSERQWLFGNVMGFVTGCLLFVAPNPGLWNDYLRAMQAYSNGSVIDKSISGNLQGPEKSSRIEGMNNLRTYKDFETGGLFPMYIYFNLWGHSLGLKYSLLIYAGIITGLLVLFYRIPCDSRETDSLFLFGFLLYILLELFIVAPRPGYSLIQWVFPLYIIAVKFQEHRTVLSLLIISFLLYHGFPFLFLFPYQFHLAELFFIVTLSYAIFRSNHFISVSRQQTEDIAASRIR